LRGGEKKDLISGLPQKTAKRHQKRVQPEQCYLYLGEKGWSPERELP